MYPVKWVVTGLFVCAAMFPNAAAQAKAIAYPSGETAPANLLRVQVRLDRPLSSAPRIDALRLEDEYGAAIAEPFYDIPILSQDGLVLTILLHPGRVKSGLGANAARGRAFSPGQVVTLRGSGPLHGLSRTWRIEAPLTTAVSVANWSLRAPPAGTRSPLIVMFDRSIEMQASAYLAIADADGARIVGAGVLGEGERQWRFTPRDPWPSGTFTLRVHPNLEDVAGNRVCAPFEAIVLSQFECQSESIAWTSSR